jgi:hypothetical protein
MTGFMPPVRKTQVQSGEPNNLRVGFRRATLRVIAAHGRVAAALPRNTRDLRADQPRSDHQCRHFFSAPAAVYATHWVGAKKSKQGF